MRILSKQKNRLLQFLNFTTSAVDRSPLRIPKNRESVKSGGSQFQLFMKRCSRYINDYNSSLVSTDMRSSATKKENFHTLLNNFSSPSLPFPAEALQFAPSSNGLLHFYNALGLEAGVWNPARMEFKYLQPSTVQRPSNTESSAAAVSALGFDSNAQDYKLMRVVENYIPGEGERGQIEVYSFKTDTWKEISTDYSRTRNFGSPSLYANGRLYCNGGDHIVSFDFAEERFSRMCWPHVRGGCEFNLVEIDGHLGCIVSPLVGTRKIFELWVKPMVGDGPWSKAGAIHSSGNTRLLGFCGNGDQFMFHELDSKNRGQLLMYDCSSNRLENVRCYYIHPNTDFFPYVEQNTIPLAQQLSTNNTFIQNYNCN